MNPILPPATLGMLGGGQLGRFFVIAAHEMGYRVLVLDPDPSSPAGRIADQHIAADYADTEALECLASQCAAVTTEFENVPADTLVFLSSFVTVRPSANAVRICQNRSAEKAFLKHHGFLHAPYADILGLDDLRHADADLFPAILKVARFGYDGKGQAQVENREEAIAAWAGFRHEACVLERQMQLDCEVSVVLTRDEAGQVKCFPVAENSHRKGILDLSLVPARIPDRLARHAEEVAVGIAQKMDYIGTLAVEFFVVDGSLYVNEMAPRPHNSGHYTLDACVTNQFEQQLRALCGLPLGDASAHCAAAMVNIMGDLWFPDHTGKAKEPDWGSLLAIPNLKLHLYGKHPPRPGRKMGHFNVIGADVDTVKKSTVTGRRAIGIQDE